MRRRVTQGPFLDGLQSAESQAEKPTLRYQSEDVCVLVEHEAFFLHYMGFIDLLLTGERHFNSENVPRNDQAIGRKR